MSSLESRLNTLRRQSGQVPASGDAPETVARRLERLRCGAASPRPGGSRPDPQALARAVGGFAEAEGYVRVERLVPWGTRHGCQALEPPVALEHLSGSGGEAAPEWVFVDTETSGLAGGTGTVPFLCGFARFEERGLRLCQYLLGGFGAEPAMLRAWTEALGPAPALVSYNGKSFDLPLLRDRLRLHGVRGGLGESAHIDLLHPVRRAYASRWADCRLATLERALLGYERSDDLPGAQVPDVWFSYLHRGQTARMADVVRHNRDDLLSLALALPRLDAVYGDPQRFGADVRQIAAARARAGDAESAFAMLEAAADSLCDAGRLELADHLRRRGEWTRACGIWEEQAGRGCVRSLERLAKYHEHVRRDWRRALVFAARLPDGADRAGRVARLQAKLG